MLIYKDKQIKSRESLDLVNEVRNANALSPTKLIMQWLILPPISQALTLRTKGLGKVEVIFKNQSCLFFRKIDSAPIYA